MLRSTHEVFGLFTLVEARDLAIEADRVVTTELTSVGLRINTDLTPTEITFDYSTEGPYDPGFVFFGPDSVEIYYSPAKKRLTVWVSKTLHTSSPERPGWETADNLMALVLAGTEVVLGRIDSQVAQVIAPKMLDAGFTRFSSKFYQEDNERELSDGTTINSLFLGVRFTFRD